MKIHKFILTFSRRSAWTAKMAFSRSELHVDDEWSMRSSALSGIFTPVVVLRASRRPCLRSLLCFRLTAIHCKKRSHTFDFPELLNGLINHIQRGALFFCFCTLTGLWIPLAVVWETKRNCFPLMTDACTRNPCSYPWKVETVFVFFNLKILLFHKPAMVLKY